MTPFRVRIVVPDEPGRLAHAARALSRLGVNILDIDVQNHDGVMWADDIVVDPLNRVDVAALDVGLRRAGFDVIDIRRIDAHEIVDQTTRALELARTVAGTSDPAAALATAARELVRSDHAWVTPAGSADAHSPVTVEGAALQALVDGTVCHAREQVKHLPSERGAWTLAVPVELPGGGRRALVLHRRSPRFSFTESARVTALARLVPLLRTSSDRTITS